MIPTLSVWIIGGLLGSLLLSVVSKCDATLQGSTRQRFALNGLFFGGGSLLSSLAPGVFLTFGWVPGPELDGAVASWPFVVATPLTLSAITFIFVAGLWRGTMLPACVPISPQTALSITLYMVIGTFIAAIFYYAYLLPTVGWDALDYWAEKGYDWLTGVERPDNYITEYRSRHPDTLNRLAAFSASVSHVHASGYFIWGVWGLMSASSVFILCSTAMLISKSYLIGAVIGCVWVSIPLIENHLLIGGYGEILLATCLLFSLSLIYLSFDLRIPVLKGVGVLACLPIFFLKNSGVIFGLIPAIGLLFVILVRRRFSMTFTYLFLLSIFVLLFYNAVVPEGNGIVALVSTKSGVKLSFGGYKLSMSSLSLPEVLSNCLHMLFVNQSFSTCFLASIFSGVFIISSRGTRDGDLFIVSTCFLALLVALLFHATDYADRVASVGSDTLGSRLLLPFFVCASMLVAASCVQVKRLKDNQSNLASSEAQSQIRYDAYEAGP